MKLKKAGSLACKKKKSFHRLEDAEKRAKEINKESDVTLRAYKCNICNKYHLTSKTDEESKQIKKYLKKYQKKHKEQYNRQIQNEAEYWINKNNWQT